MRYCRTQGFQPTALGSVLGPDRPKWKQGIGCTTIRSINIGKTNQVVWDVIKSMLTPFSERSLEFSVHPIPGVLTLDDSDGMSAEQIDVLSVEEKKVLISHIIDRITVHFDKGNGNHRLNVEWSERVLDGSATSEPVTEAPLLWHWGTHQPQRIEAVEPRRDPSPTKKHLRRATVLATESVHSVTVE